MRIAAAADVHARQGDEERIRAMFSGVSEIADVLVLAGDLTDHGRPAETEALLRGLHGVDVPVVTVLGNHDHEAGAVRDLVRMLQSSGIHCLDRTSVTIDGVGFAGVKGFGGGYEARIVKGFGEDALKAFVSESVIEAESLRGALLGLDTPKRVAVMHYSPTLATLQGEPPEIHAFLGTSRLAQAVDEGRAQLAIHGHAHHGAMLGKTPGGVPVHNVAIPVLKAAGHQRPYVILEV